MNPSETLDRFSKGDRRALARVLTMVENRSREVPELMRELYRRAGKAAIVGITGPPGAGKSTLSDKLIARFREQGRTVGVVAVDPSSPYSGGAILGDRIRMQSHFLDEGVFIRSLSTRGRHGGLARASREIAHALDAFGFDVILVETVGVGQTELDIMRLAHTTVVVLVPEAGDTIQVMKAGLLEIADIFVVNKADREGAGRLRNELQVMLQMRPDAEWKVPVLTTEATAGKGVEEVAAAIVNHMDVWSATRDLARERVAEWGEILRDEIAVRLDRAFTSQELAPIADRLRGGGTDPYSAALEVLADPSLLAEILGERGKTPA